MQSDIISQDVAERRCFPEGHNLITTGMGIVSMGNRCMEDRQPGASKNSQQISSCYWPIRAPELCDVI